MIAQDARPRGQSRLMVLDRSREGTQLASIADLPRFLRDGDVLVLNNTRVFAARLLGHRVPSGGAVECLLLDRSRQEQEHSDTAPPAPGTRHQAPGTEIWNALMHPGQKLKPGARVKFDGDAGVGVGVLHGEILERRFQGRRTIRLWSDAGEQVDALIDALGHVPLPPYIKRPDTPADRERYQTVYARVRGSVAAPTAGLHFTPELLDELAKAGVERAEITLHVGYGTFKPVKVDRVEDHVVDAEPYVIDEQSADRINSARRDGRRVIAVGTTTTRALEDAAVRGNGVLEPGGAFADLFIHPGFEFKVIDGLLTNFHLPRSSLLMLVSAFGGRERVLAAYHAAVGERYRFYSYGDAMLIL